jgi:hypothetical protein
MKNFELNALGVVEMTQEEMILVDGENIFKTIGEAISKAVDAIGSALGDAVDTAGEAVGQAWDWVKTHTVLSNGGAGILLPGR